MEMTKEALQPQFGTFQFDVQTKASNFDEDIRNASDLTPFFLLIFWRHLRHVTHAESDDV